MKNKKKKFEKYHVPDTAPALSLLRYLCHELLGCCLSLLDVSYLFGYALRFSTIPIAILSTHVTDTATGIVYMYQSSVPGNILVNKPVVADLGLSYFTVSFSLNILLTSMIVTRLVWHRRNIRNAMGTSAGVGQLYRAIITILVESAALYAVSFLLFLVPWAADSWVDKTFWLILFEVQVRAAFTVP